MIRSKIIHDDKKPYMTELTTDRVGINPVIADSAVCEQSCDMAPSELLAAALASCTSMTIRGLLMKRGIPYDEVYVDVDIEPLEGKTVIHRSMRIVSAAPQEQLDAVIKRAEKCYVGKLLTGSIEIEDN